MKHLLVIVESLCPVDKKEWRVSNSPTLFSRSHNAHAFLRPFRVGWHTHTCEQTRVTKNDKNVSNIDSYSIILKLFEARVGLARAIYSDAEVYLLDDPLAAVDSKVSKNSKFSKSQNSVNPTDAFITSPGLTFVACWFLTPLDLIWPYLTQISNLSGLGSEQTLWHVYKWVSCWQDENSSHSPN